MSTITSLADLERVGCAQVEGPRLRVRVPPDWPIAGEQRIGYVSILRLVESVRELHWRRDIEPYAGADPANLDSITRTLNADFLAPVLAGALIVCDYALLWVRSRSYGLLVTLTDGQGGELARIELASVFIDPATLRPVALDPDLATILRKQLPSAGEE